MGPKPACPVTDTSATGGGDSEGDGGLADVRRWSNRPELSADDDVTRGGRSGRPTPGEPQPSRNPEQDWGAVLVAVGLVVVLLAAGVLVSLLMGGLLGILTVWGAVILAALLVAMGSVGLYQGWRVYHGR